MQGAKPKAAAAPPQKPNGKPGKKKAPKKGAKSSLSTAAKLGGLFNPKNGVDVPSHVVQGKALSHTGLVRDNISISNATSASNGRMLLLFANTGSAGTVGMRWTQTNGVLPLVTMLTCPTLLNDGPNGGPESGRAMKLGIDIVNNTQLLNAGGRVYVLNLNQRLLFPAAPSIMTPSQVDAVCDFIAAHPDTRTYAGSDFMQPREIAAFPVDMTNLGTFREWQGTLGMDAFCLYLADWPSATTSPRSMSTLAIVIDIPAATNVYTVSARASFYTRWPVNTIMGQVMKTVPVAPLTALNLAQAAAQDRGSVMAPSSYAGSVRAGSIIG